jgi:hypothetical protein
MLVLKQKMEKTMIKIRTYKREILSMFEKEKEHISKKEEVKMEK